MKQLICMLICTFAIATASAQSVVVGDMDLTEDQEIGSADRDLEFEQGTKIVTNGFKLDILAKRIFGNNTNIVTFPENARTGVDGLRGTAAGGNGSNAENGVDGKAPRPISIQAGEFVEEQGILTIAAHGQNGGSGGRGGNGIRGAAGANGGGPDVSDCWFGNCRRSGSDGATGGRGGNSGRGGHAGRGGDGGTVIIAVASGDEHIVVTVDPGNPGTPGAPGTVGPGGNGGEGGNGHLCCGGGRNGSKGPDGASGGTGSESGSGLAGEIYRITM